MISLDIPKSGRSGRFVFYMRHGKLCRRLYVIPKNVRTPARRRTRGAFGSIAKAWSRRLTEPQRLAWIASAAKVQSHPRLSQSGPLTGEMHFQGLNSARAQIGLELLLWPPEPVVFAPNPVHGLSLSFVHGQLRLRLRVSGPVTQAIMVFAQAPCSPDRQKWRQGPCLGLLPPPQAGESDITDLYVQHYGQPEPGQKVFIRTRQQSNGWEGPDHDLSEVVPAPPPIPLARPNRLLINQEAREPSPDLEYRRRPLPSLRLSPPTPHCPRIPRPSPSISVRCTMHKGVLPEQYRTTSQAAPVHDARCTGCSPAQRTIRRLRPLGLRAATCPKPHCRELWRGG